ncbi:hypothetical protein TVAG_052030 [Trichomonas vaginalis G3]|uniref:Uncharacterized protein n=1 Tax=Trichomonas vaginalis (strain ATCC PRA-98 / G3) TaxID=412133 RepID=A2F4J9_TRIV3|nr:armadillo (ARM) repeat-containing protein family [Trichomonas vaginalis G3]EAY00155.1 hypothetical protein TVAG_052030 [Trichomonas vaginalis G3]KAI5541120.1 armadillo (ARM) repeat-containing protein family [Trichomonas vaginalis G3]|eukprot:XP_001313084.1 hypothetical protein [Trichomonas vaginalis G3]
MRTSNKEEKNDNTSIPSKDNSKNVHRSPRKAFSLSIMILDNLEKFINHEYDQETFITSVNKRSQGMTSKEKLFFASKFNFVGYFNALLEISTQNQNLFYQGLHIISTFIKFPSTKKLKLYTENNISVLNEIFHSCPAENCSDCLAIISDLIEYNYAYFEFFYQNGFIERIQKIPPSGYGVVIIREMYKNSPETQNEFINLIPYFETSNDVNVRKEIIATLHFLSINGESDEIKQFSLNNFLEQFYNLQDNKTHEQYIETWKFICDIPAENVTIPLDYAKIIIKLIEETELDKEDLDLQKSQQDFISAASNCLRHLHDAWEGEIDEQVCTLMKKYYGSSNFNCNVSTFNCFIAYLHFEEWFDEQIAEDIKNYCESSEVAYACFPIILSAFHKLQSDELFELIQDLIPIAEIHMQDDDEKIKNIAELFYNEASQI